MPLHHQVNRQDDDRPTMRMWLAEIAVFLVASAVTFIVCLAVIGRPVTLDAGSTALLIAVSAGVGVLVSGRFRSWGLRRKKR